MPEQDPVLQGIFWLRVWAGKVPGSIHGEGELSGGELQVRTQRGGVGAGVKVTPVAFLVIKEGSVRMLPVANPANTTADRLVEMIPDTLDKIAAFIDSRTEKKAE